MGRVSASDLRQVLTFVGSVEPGMPADPLPMSTLLALRTLLGADDADYFEFRRADRAVLAASSTYEGHPAPGSDDAMIRFGSQNPLGWRRWKPADGAMRMSERMAFRDLERTDWYQGFMRPNRLRDTLKVWLWVSPESVACVQLWSDTRDFTRRQQDLLAVLHHHLIALRDRALRPRRDAGAAPSLTPREAEVLSWIARGESEPAIAARLGIAPSTVAKHVENAFAKLGAHSRSDAIARILFDAPSGAD
jgi:DNA-binding CsgD family transcriptional regulator